MVLIDTSLHLVHYVTCIHLVTSSVLKVAYYSQLSIFELNATCNITKHTMTNYTKHLDIIHPILNMATVTILTNKIKM